VVISKKLLKHIKIAKLACYSKSIFYFKLRWTSDTHITPHNNNVYNREHKLWTGTQNREHELWTNLWTWSCYVEAASEL